MSIHDIIVSLTDIHMNERVQPPTLLPVLFIHPWFVNVSTAVSYIINKLSDCGSSTNPQTLKQGNPVLFLCQNMRLNNIFWLSFLCHITCRLNYNIPPTIWVSWPTAWEPLCKGQPYFSCKPIRVNWNYLEQRVFQTDAEYRFIQTAILENNVFLEHKSMGSK